MKRPRSKAISKHVQPPNNCWTNIAFDGIALAIPSRCDCSRFECRSAFAERESASNAGANSLKAKALESPERADQPRENVMKRFGKLLIAAGTTAALLGSAALAQNSMNDPARDGYIATMKDKKVVFVPVFMGLDLTEGWSRMMAKQAAALGYKYEVRNSNFNTAAGAQTLTSLITEKPDVIVVQNPDVQSYAKLLSNAEKAGIHVIQLNMKTNVLTSGFVGADVVDLGETQAKAAVAACGKGSGKSGKVLILEGPPTSPFSAYMLKGYQNILDKADGIKVVSTQSTGDYESAKAKAITQVALQQNPDLCGGNCSGPSGIGVRPGTVSGRLRWPGGQICG